MEERRGPDHGPTTLHSRASGRPESWEGCAHYLGDGHARVWQGPQREAEAESRPRHNGQGGYPEEVAEPSQEVREWRQSDSYHEAWWMSIHVSWPRDLLTVVKRSEVRMLEAPPTPDVQGNPGGSVLCPLPPLPDILWLGHRGKPRQPQYWSICPPRLRSSFRACGGCESLQEHLRGGCHLCQVLTLAMGCSREQCTRALPSRSSLVERKIK